MRECSVSAPGRSGTGRSGIGRSSTRRSGLYSVPQSTLHGAIWAWTIPVALLGSWTCFANVPGINWTLWTLAAATGFLVIGRRSGRASADVGPRATTDICPRAALRAAGLLQAPPSR